MLAPFAALILAVQSPPSSQDRELREMDAIVAVEQTLDRLHAAASEADAAEYWSLFAPDARFVGTDGSEHWTLDAFKAYADPVFARGRGWTYKVNHRYVGVLPLDCACVAFFEEKLTNASYGETRGSGVVRLTDDGWKIEQYVLSFAVPNDAADEVVEAIKAFKASQAAAD